MDIGDIAGNPIAQLMFLILSAAGGYKVWRAAADRSQGTC